jgi:penicillin-binding protein 1C
MIRAPRPSSLSRRTWIVAAGSAMLLMVGVILWVRFGAIDPELLDRTKHQSFTILDRHGEVLYEPLASSGNRSEWLTAETLPELVVEATLAAEDRRFFSHFGIDPIAVTRAALHNVRALRIVEGGSTITQQVGKLLLGSRDRSPRQKIREAVLAMRMERRFSKREILALYLNLAPYGNRIDGVERASRSYFGTDAAHLTPAQAAFLASLPQRPSAFNPLRDPDRARSRQRSILERMKLTPEERALAVAERLRFTPMPQEVIAMHFVERLREREPATPRMRTSLDVRLQRQVRGIIGAHRETLLRHGAGSVAVAVLDNRTGEWLAWEGSGDYFSERFGGAIDGVATPRQPGSALKPFTYALAFESGHSPASVLPDVPSHFPTAEAGVIYSPRNYDGSYRGPLRVRMALAGSQNVPAVAMLARLGPESLLRLLRNCGFTELERTADHYGLGLTLGDGEVTLEQLVTAYATFARGGKTIEPVMIASGTAAGGRQLLSPRTAFWITDVLSDPAAREHAFGSGGSLDFPFPVAVKTGTSQAYRDNWTVGYTREVTVGVWVGNFDRKELRGSSGVTGAAPIFNAVMLAATERVRGALPIGSFEPILLPPDDVAALEICVLSGARPTRWCPATQREWLATDTPALFCDWHHDGAIDWPAEYRGWAGASRATPAIRRADAGVTPARAASLRISNPPDGATFLIDPTLRREFQTLRLRAVSDSTVSWAVGDERIGTSSPGGSLEWPLTPGIHTIRARDGQGREEAVRIVVK